MKNDVQMDQSLREIRTEASQDNLDIQSIIKKYGGGLADSSWVNELGSYQAKEAKTLGDTKKGNLGYLVEEDES